jgi:thioredoxin 1
MANLLNRIFGSGDQPATGEALAGGSAPIHVTDSDFEKLVLNSDVPVIVDFWAPWCMPCRMIAPVLEKLAAEFDGRALIAKVNTDEHPQWAIQYGVQGIPTLLFVKDGQVADRMVGVAPAGQIKQKLDQLL